MLLYILYHIVMLLLRPILKTINLYSYISSSDKTLEDLGKLLEGKKAVPINTIEAIMKHLFCEIKLVGIERRF